MKEWIKKQWIYHKKEIIVAAASVIGTVAVIHLKQKGNISFDTSFRIEIGDSDTFQDTVGKYMKDAPIYTSLTLDHSDLTIGDLGKLGDIILRNFPMLATDSPISHCFVSGRYPLNE